MNHSGFVNSIVSFIERVQLILNDPFTNQTFPINLLGWSFNEQPAKLFGLVL